jgi:predicted peptidase
MKRIIAMIVCLMMVFSTCALAERGGMGGPGGGMGGPGGGMGGGMTQNDEEIQAILDANASKFQQFTFTDEETSNSLEYSLFIPEDYDASKSYPLIMFIPDSTGAGKSAAEIVEQYYGATVWVTDEEQAKHASFVLVPAFTGTVTTDNWDADPQIDATVKLIEQLEDEYSIDADRLYTTGQSMGCMSSLYLNSKYPDLFAASLYVSGQWDISVLSGMENQKFFYVTAGGDEKASGGQDEVMAMFDADGVAYSYGTWNAQDSAEDQDAAVAELVAEGLDANMIRFETGTVFKEGQTGMEHMASFNYAYKLTAVRDWIFEQVKA